MPIPTCCWSTWSSRAAEEEPTEAAGEAATQPEVIKPERKEKDKED